MPTENTGFFVHWRRKASLRNSITSARISSSAAVNSTPMKLSASAMTIRSIAETLALDASAAAASASLRH